MAYSINTAVATEEQDRKPKPRVKQRHRVTKNSPEKGDQRRNDPVTFTGRRRSANPSQFDVQGVQQLTSAEQGA